MWDLSSLTRDQIHTPEVEVQSLNHWTAREVKPPYFLNITHQKKRQRERERGRGREKEGERMGSSMKLEKLSKTPPFYESSRK